MSNNTQEKHEPQELLFEKWAFLENTFICKLKMGFFSKLGQLVFFLNFYGIMTSLALQRKSLFWK